MSVVNCPQYIIFQHILSNFKLIGSFEFSLQVSTSWLVNLNFQNNIWPIRKQLFALFIKIVPNQVQESIQWGDSTISRNTSSCLILQYRVTRMNADHKNDTNNNSQESSPKVIHQSPYTHMSTSFSIQWRHTCEQKYNI